MSKRTLKKILLKSQLLDIEEKECSELDIAYAREFASDFSEELRLRTKPESPPKKVEKYEIPSNTLKKIHRKLAMVTHPDVAKEDLPFKEVQSAYEEGDASKLLSLASDLRVDIELSEKEMRSLVGQMAAKRARIDSVKQTVRWAWCTSGKSPELRSRIRRAMGISDEAWSTYLNKKDPSKPSGEKDET